MTTRRRHPSCDSCIDSYLQHRVVMASSCLISVTNDGQGTETEPCNSTTSWQPPPAAAPLQTEPYNSPTNWQPPPAATPLRIESCLLSHLLPSSSPVKPLHRPVSSSWTRTQHQSLEHLLNSSSGFPTTIPSQSCNVLCGNTNGTAKRSKIKRPKPTIQRRRGKSTSNVNDSSSRNHKHMNTNDFQTTHESDSWNGPSFKGREVNGGRESSPNRNHRRVSEKSRGFSKPSPSRTTNGDSSLGVAPFWISERKDDEENRKDHEAYFNYSDDDCGINNGSGRPFPSPHSTAGPGSTSSSIYGVFSALSPAGSLKVKCRPSMTMSEMSQPGLSSAKDSNGKPPRHSSIIKGLRQGPAVVLPATHRSVSSQPTTARVTGPTVPATSLFSRPQHCPPDNEETLENAIERINGMQNLMTSACIENRSPVQKKQPQDDELEDNIPSLIASMDLSHRPQCHLPSMDLSHRPQCPLPSMDLSHRPQCPMPEISYAGNVDSDGYQYVDAVCGGNGVYDQAGNAYGYHDHVYELVDDDHHQRRIATENCHDKQQSNERKNNRACQNNVGIQTEKEQAYLYMVGQHYESIGKHNKKKDHTLNGRRRKCHKENVDTTRNSLIKNLERQSISSQRPCFPTDDNRGSNQYVAQPRTNKDFHRKHERFDRHPDYPQQVSDRPMPLRSAYSSETSLHYAVTDVVSAFPLSVVSGVVPGVASVSDRPMPLRSAYSSETSLHYAVTDVVTAFPLSAVSGVVPGVASGVVLDFPPSVASGFPLRVASGVASGFASGSNSDNIRDALDPRSLMQRSGAPARGPARRPSTPALRRDTNSPAGSQDSRVRQEGGGPHSNCSSETHLYAEIEEKPSEIKDSPALPRMRRLSASSKKFMKKFSLCLANS